MSAIVLYTASEVAELLRLNHQVVQRKLQAGDIPDTASVATGGSSSHS